MMKLSNIYYSPRGYWKGFAAVAKLAKAGGVSKKVARSWLNKQALWQIYLPPPRYVPRPKFDISEVNAVHQADLLFLPHDRPSRGRKLYKYALTVVDVASRYKDAEPLATKEAKEVADALSRIYKRGPLRWPNILQVDPGKEFMGAVTKLLEQHNTNIRRGEANDHRAQAIVERFNRTLAEKLFGYQQAQELLLESGKRSRAWVKRLPSVVSALNNEVTRLTGKKPIDAIKDRVTTSKPSTPAFRKVGLEEQKLPSTVGVRYLYQPGESEGDQRRRATDPIWSLEVYTIERSIIKPNEPVLYYLYDAPTTRGFVREELQIVPNDTQLPPNNIL